MTKRCSALYNSQLSGTSNLLAAAIARGCQGHGRGAINLVYRADDIGVPSAQFTEMITIFQRYRQPLCLAVVPTWLTASRLQVLREITGDDDSRWCWHQHGRSHTNHEIEGKKQEFGPAREYPAIFQDIEKGKRRLQHLLGEAFQPYFTPPWNRCSRDTAKALKILKFRAMSRSKGAKPDVSDLLADIQVNVDLHTRKESDPVLSLNALLAELETSLQSGYCAIMLHHQRMNTRAYAFLAELLQQLSRRKEIAPCLFSDLS